MVGPTPDLDPPAAASAVGAAGRTFARGLDATGGHLRLGWPWSFGLPPAGWAALVAGALVVGGLAIAAARRTGSGVAAGLGLALLAGWALADTRGRWSAAAVLEPGRPASTLVDATGGAVALPSPVALARADLPETVALVARLRGPGREPLLGRVEAAPGRSLRLWPGPGQTEVAVVATGTGQPLPTRVPGDGPPATHLRWASGQRKGAIYDTWLLDGGSPVADPEGRFALSCPRTIRRTRPLPAPSRCAGAAPRRWRSGRTTPSSAWSPRSPPRCSSARRASR